eukprot:1159072-Pelagomonas_calceolata.AAC.1
MAGPLHRSPASQLVLPLLSCASFAFEAQRVRYLESENAELMRAVELAAQDAAEAGRKEYRKKREVQLAAEAQAALKRAQVYAATRRQPEAMKMKSQASVPGVFAWTTPVRAGQERKFIQRFANLRSVLHGRLHLCELCSAYVS